MEWQANYMSSALLMPKSTVIKLIDELNIQQGLSNNFFKVDAANVSWKAAEYRLRGLGLIKSGPLLVSLDINKIATHVFLARGLLFLYVK
jgi:Zn-dependent peptidase ImmA (M78 family)